MIQPGGRALMEPDERAAVLLALGRQHTGARVDQRADVSGVSSRSERIEGLFTVDRARDNR
jgi:hypothetical protein